MASAGIGSSSQLAGELLKDMAGIEMMHIPYRGGGPAIVSLLGAQVDVFFSPMAIAVAHVRAGKLRALATTGIARSDALPEIPTVSEFVPDYETSYRIGLGAPRNTPAEIVSKLNKEINAALAEPGTTSRFADIGGSVVGGSSTDFAKLVSDETEKWGKLIRADTSRPSTFAQVEGLAVALETRMSRSHASG